MRVWALAATAALAGCGSQQTATPPNNATTDASSARSASDAPVAPAAPAAPDIAFGTTSALTGQTSGLTGVVSDFMVQRTDTGTRVELAADTLFEFDKATLSPGAQTNLARTADLVRQGAADGTITVIGHSDAKGDDAYNLALSKRRAQSVVDWLRSQPGLASRRFVAEGRGEAEPVAPNAGPGGADDPAGRARNRRVVVDIPR